MILSALFAGAIYGLFISGAIIVATVVCMSVKYLFDYAKNKLKANNKNKVMVSQTKDLFKEKMNTANKKSLSQLQDLVDEYPVITGVYNPDTDDVEDIQAIKTKQVDVKLKSAMNNAKNGMLIIEN